MLFVDEITIEARAGHGGRGVVRWLHEKGKEFSGPAGGNGGNGGDVYIHAVRDLNMLSRYRGEKNFVAEDGDDGGNRNKEGRGGANILIDLPVGSIVRNTNTGEVFELTRDNEKKLILKGGRGGVGNAVFKSSVNRSPKESTQGARGEEAALHIELRLIADVGIVGLPNAGKSSLLNALTGARATVDSYAFTTLDPNLGVLYGTVLADIPGLIEGASSGKGLGFKFLRHISRTRLLLHCVSLESETPLVDYHTVRKEIADFESGTLAKKPEILVLTKSDTRDSKQIKDSIKIFKKEGLEASVVSILDDNSIKTLRDRVLAALSAQAGLG